jgi:hypothetical protein
MQDYAKMPASPQSAKIWVLQINYTYSIFPTELQFLLQKILIGLLEILP